jgi:corrinoid protein of di/trimethylamine methyltransferase
MVKADNNEIGIILNTLSCEKIFSEKRAFLRLESNDMFEIALVVSGSGIHRVLDKDIPSKQGDIFVIPPHTPHGYFIEKENDDFAIRRLFWNMNDWFSGECANHSSHRYCYGIFRENSTLGYAVLNATVFDDIAHLWNIIESEIEMQKEEYKEAIRGVLSYFLITISRYINSSVKNLSFASCEEWNIVSSAIKIIREEYDDPSLTKEKIAERLYVSKSHLGRIFSKITGKFFSDYLRDIRLNNVCQLLEKSDSNINDVARKCGFINIPSFYKNFEAKMNMTPNEYRQAMLPFATCTITDEYIKLLKGEKIMGILNDISENLQKGKSKIVKQLVGQALDEGVKPNDILSEGLLRGMSIIGEKFKNNEVFVPEVLVAARAMNMGAQILKPYLAEAGIKAVGKVCIGTVQGDLHDIGKNLVKMMLEGKGLEVIDLGTDVAAETFIQTAIEQDCRVICCSALLTTTMPVMAEVVKLAEAKGIRDKVKIMIGGAPVSQEYCNKIGADCYTVDAASAADAAVEFCKAQ